MPTSNNQLRDDPVFLNARREAIVILSLWAVCFVYTCSYCYLRGYLTHTPHPAATGPAIGELVGDLSAFDRAPKSTTFPLGWGIPDWIFYGVIAPWLLCIVVTFWFVLFYFQDDNLEV